MAYASYADLKNRTSGGSSSGSSSSSSSSSSKSSKKISDYATLKKAVAPNIDKVRGYLAERDKQKKTVENYNNAAEQAKKYQVEAEQAQKKLSFWETIANLPKEIVKSAVVRPAVSLAEIPKNVYGTTTGKENTFGEMNVPFLGKVESYQNESKRIAGEIVDNQKPVTAILKPMGEAILDVGSLGVGGSVVKQGAKAGLVSAMKKGVVEGALYGAGYGGTQALGEGQGFKEAAKTIGTGALIGGAAGGVLGVGGGMLAKQAEKRALSSAVKKIETTVGKMDMHEISLVEQGLKEGLTEDTILKGIEKSREPFKPIEDEAPKVAETTVQTKEKFEQAKNLTEKDRQVETKAFDKIKQNEETILQKYSEEHGKVVNSDDFRKEFIDEGYKGANAEAVQEPSSYLAKKAYIRALNNDGEFATFLAGGSGSGKTSAIKNTKAIQTVIDNSSVVLDSNLSSYDSAIKKIDEAVNAGKAPYVAYVYRDPIDAFENGVVKRMKDNKSEMGRIVPNRIIAENHIGSFEVAKKLLSEGYQVDVLDNSLGYKKQRLSNIDEIGAKFKYTEKELTEKLNKEAEKLYKKGELTKEQYGRYIGKPVKETPTKKTVKKSEFAERLNKELPEDLKINEDYNVAHMKGEVNKAEKLINKDVNKALEIATGVEKSDANTQTATSIMLAEKAKKEGDWQTVAQLYNLRRMANTRRGQEIAMEKMSVLLNPEERYMKQVVDARLNGVKVGSPDIADILKRKPKAERVFERTKKQVVDLKKELNLSVKIEKAEKVFSDLICK